MCPAFCFSNHFPQVPEEIQMALKQMTGGPFSIRVREKQLKLHWDAIFRLSQGQKPKSMIMCFAGGAEGPRAVLPIAGRSGNWCKSHGGLFSNVDQNCPCCYSLTRQHNFSECFPLSALYLACFKKNVQGDSHAALYRMAEFWKQATYPPGGAGLIKSGPPHKK